MSQLYFCDVTILTVGFGDLAPKSDLGRGLVFPFSVGGIIMLGLVISSIHYFVQELGADKVVKTHFEKHRQRTVDKTVKTSTELQRRESDAGVLDVQETSIPKKPSTISRAISNPTTAMGKSVRRVGQKMLPNTILPKKNKVVLLREERDRFNAMRDIQVRTGRFKSWWALGFSIIAFAVLWCVGAVVFWQCEKDTQGMTYFQALYFCYVSLLTIGYGDLSPKSNPGRCFFVVWSLIAVPTMTVLISDMGDTVISKFKKATWKLADFTVLPKFGIWRSILDKVPFIVDRLQQWEDKRAKKKRKKKGIPNRPPDEEMGGDAPVAPDIEEIARRIENDEEQAPSDHELARQLALAIRRTANELSTGKKKKYSYEQWVEFTMLIRFTRRSTENNGDEEDDLVEWDWIGEDSPMVSGVSEPEFVLDRLCESMRRYIGKQGALSQESGGR